jgi:hypothetical protein
MSVTNARLRRLVVMDGTTMNETNRILILEGRLLDLRRRVSQSWERSIIEAACAAIEAEILALGRRSRSDYYWRGPAPAAAGVALVAC